MVEVLPEDFLADEDCRCLFDAFLSLLFDELVNLLYRLWWIATGRDSAAGARWIGYLCDE